MRFNLESVTRIEVINHSSTGPIGRVFIFYANEGTEIQFEVQGGGRTLKAFVVDKNGDVPNALL